MEELKHPAMDLKKEAAKAAIAFIQPNQKIGLGAGSTMAHMVQLLQAAAAEGLAVSVYTASFATAQLLQQHGFAVQATGATATLDLYFDGCDQFDQSLNALKSGGGIHTNEKLLASMAKEFILVGDESKFAQTLDTRFPLVIEVLPAALAYAEARINALFPGVTTVLRRSGQKDGAVVTDNGNYLIDTWFSTWPPLETINPVLKTVTGILETSLFYNMAAKAIIAGPNGTRVLAR